MTKEIAFQNLVNVARAFKGNADEHDNLRESIQIISQIVFPPPATEPPKPEEVKNG